MIELPNLASPRYLSRRQWQQLLILATIGLLLLGGYFTARIHAAQAQREDLRRLQAQLVAQQDQPTAESPSLTDAEIKQVRQAITNANALIVRDAFSWTRLLGQLEATLTEGTTLTSINPQPDNRSIRLSGQTRTVESLQSYLKSLLESEQFSDVYLLRQERDNADAKKPGVTPAIRFQLNVLEAF